MRNGRFDGMDDLFTNTTNSSSSSSNGSPNMADHSPRGALHHALHQSIRQNLNPYFQNAHLVAIGASPAGSPLQNPSSISSPRSMGSDSNTPTVGSPPPAPLAGFAHLTGTFPSDDAYSSSFPVQQLHSHFPFRPDAHTSTAIRG